MQVNLDALAGSPPARDCGRVGFIGAGRVGQALAQAFARAGVAVAAVSSRSLASAQALAQPLGAMGSRPLVQPQPDVLVQACDTVFITVQDDHIADVAQALPWRPGLCVVHCSGRQQSVEFRGATAVHHAQAWAPRQRLGHIGDVVILHRDEDGVTGLHQHIGLRLHQRPAAHGAQG
ncbi:MAG: NAD(P)-binding domain-containing protein, partial [Betaproteobacteria bacterium]